MLSVGSPSPSRGMPSPARPCPEPSPPERGRWRLDCGPYCCGCLSCGFSSPSIHISRGLDGEDANGLGVHCGMEDEKHSHSVQLTMAVAGNDAQPQTRPTM